MPDRNWDSELKKIDRRLESVSDEALLPAPRDASPAAQARVAEERKSTNTFGVFARLTLSVLLGVGMLFWPYAARCGVGLAAYLGATAAVVAGGMWSSVWTWRHRSGRAHTLALLIIVWGLVLAAIEVLPRVGYATPTPEHPALWSCG
jgi:putative flippase GtrA